MKKILMWDTVVLKCTSQKHLNDLLAEGFEVKEVNNIRYLVKDES